MTPERINQLHEFGLLGREAIELIAAQQREIEGLLGLLIHKGRLRGDIEEGYFVRDAEGNRYWHYTFEQAKVAVRAAWEGK